MLLCLCVVGEQCLDTCESGSLRPRRRKLIGEPVSSSLLQRSRLLFRWRASSTFPRRCGAAISGMPPWGRSACSWLPGSRSSWMPEAADVRSGGGSSSSVFVSRSPSCLPCPISCRRDSPVALPAGGPMASQGPSHEPGTRRARHADLSGLGPRAAEKRWRARWTRWSGPLGGRALNSGRRSRSCGRGGARC